MWLLWAVLVGLVVGWLACKIVPGEENLNLVQTILLGIGGSFVGGAINWLVGWGDNIISPSGIVMSLVGAVLIVYVFANRQTIMDWFSSFKN